MNATPWTYTSRPDTRISNARLGVWLFLASEAMLFGSLVSAYVLLRAGASSWPDAGVLNARHAYMMTPVLLAATLVFNFRRATSPQARLLGSSALFAGFLGMKLLDYVEKWSVGVVPATNVLLGCWYTITAVHALHVAGGIAANFWMVATAGQNGDRDRERFYTLGLYWYFVDLVWVVILIGFYLV
jgi:heme/copper-type cytochrome/quinol oxidase subunit 3